jgi:hypothetical protein
MCRLLRKVCGGFGLFIERCHIFFRDDGCLVIDGEDHFSPDRKTWQCGKVVLQNVCISRSRNGVNIEGKAEPITPEFN